MFKPLCLAVLLLLGAPARSRDVLTPIETKWTAAALPVVRVARAQGLPVDIVVQPGNQPDASPIAMGIKDGRCELVLSFRGNPAADALQASVPPALFEAAAEAVFAHEIGHCRRWMQGEWHGLPAGFAEAVDRVHADDTPEIAALRRAMRGTQREEGYADLVALAWTQRAHPAQYAPVLDWLERYRADALPGEHHDTGAWLRLAREPSALGRGDDMFRAALTLWERGLRAP